MSVQFFKGVGGSDKVMYNGSTGAAYTGFAVKCAGKITVPIANQNGGRRSQIVTFDAMGSSLVEAIDNATDIMQTILNRSNGYLTMFTLQCGLYRKDIEGTPVEAGSLKYGSVKVVNTRSSSGAAVAVSKAKSMSIYFPFVNTKNLQLLEDDVASLIADGKLCNVSFHDDNKNSFDVTPFTWSGQGTIKDYVANEIALLESNDTSAGGSDGVLRKRPITNP